MADPVSNKGLRGAMMKKNWPKCRVCHKKFDNQGWAKVVMCDDCYGSQPYRDKDCDNVCADQPRAFSCTKVKCKCPVHSPITITQLLNGERDAHTDGTTP